MFTKITTYVCCKHLQCNSSFFFSLFYLLLYYRNNNLLVFVDEIFCVSLDCANLVRVTKTTQRLWAISMFAATTVA